MKEYDYFAAADLYLDGKLQGEELAMFENKLKSNKALVEEVKLHEEINKFIAFYLFKQTLNKASKEYFERQKKYDKKIYGLFRNTYTIAAACVVTFLISSIVFWNFFIKKTPDLYSQYYTRIETYGITRGPAEDAESIMQDGMCAYENNEFNSALLYFNEVLELDSTRIDAIYYSAGVAMETRQYEKAEKLLLKITKYNCLLKNNALWYLSLCYLKLGRLNKAKVILKDFACNKESYYYEKATSLLLKINQETHVKKNN